MQIISQNEVEGGISRRVGPMDPIICTGRNSRCMEGEYNGGIGIRRS